MLRGPLLVVWGVGTLFSGAILAGEPGGPGAEKAPPQPREAKATETHPSPAFLQFALYSPVQLVSPSRGVTGLRLSGPWGKNENLTGVDLALGVAETQGHMTGLGVSGFGNCVLNAVTGLEVAGFGNLVGERVHGCQVGGAANVAHEMWGLQVACLANGATWVTGAQAALFSNQTSESLTGVQLAGVENCPADLEHTRAGRFAGVQLAGLGNFVPGDSERKDEAAAGALMQGVQVGGLTNRVDGQMMGLQAAGLSNTTQGDLHGAQLGALGNYAQTVHGLQVGLINRCERLRGFQLGLINVRSGSRFPFVPLVNFHF